MCFREFSNLFDSKPLPPFLQNIHWGALWRTLPSNFLQMGPACLRPFPAQLLLFTISEENRSMFVLW